MKLYQSEQDGRLYWLKGTDLMFLPIEAKNGLYDTEQGNAVDWLNFVRLRLIVSKLYGKLCDNTDHASDEHIDVKPVVMREEFEGGVFNWCAECRKRDDDFIDDEADENDPVNYIME